MDTKVALPGSQHGKFSGVCGATGVETVYLLPGCSQYQDSAERAVVISTSESGGAIPSKCFMELFNTLQSRTIHYRGSCKEIKRRFRAK